MKATFDGTILSPGGFDGADVWLVRFRPSMSQPVQVARRCRAEYVTLFARGGRVITIELLFIPPPSVDVHEAFAELALFCATLPQQGDLVLESGARQVTYPGAVITDFSPPPRRGVANEFPLTFQAGAPVYVALSTLAQMDSRYPNILDLAGLTGGGSTKLDGQITADVAVMRVVKFYLLESSVLTPHEWTLLTWTDEVEDASAGVVIPDDFHSTTNPKYWHRTL